MIFSAHQPHYLPWLGYFDKIQKSDCFVFLDAVQYKKREFQNRNKIRTSQGAQWLSVPVLSKSRYDQLLKDVEIDNSVPWAQDHWRTLKANYARAPFFNSYRPFFDETYTRPWKSLVDLNVHLVRFLLYCFEIKTQLFLESEIGIKGKATERLISLATRLKAETYLSGIGGKNYLDTKRFEETGLRLEYQVFHHPVYPQRFMKSPQDFIPQLAAVDLLFNEGPHAKTYFQKKEMP